jgi:hypothetical protein
MSFSIAGVSFRQWAITQIVTAIVEDGADITAVDITNIPGKIVSEPDNKFDPAAKKVTIAGRHVGYIPKGMTATIPDGDCKLSISYWSEKKWYLVRYILPEEDVLDVVTDGLQQTITTDQTVAPPVVP